MANLQILNEFVFIAERYGILQQKDKQVQWAQAGIDWANQQGTNLDPFALGNLYYATNQFAIAKPLFQEAIDQNGNTWLNLSRLGNTCQQLGNRKDVQVILKQLADLYTKNQDAGYLVAQAHIYSHTDNKDKAVTLLNRAIKKGFAYGPTTYQNDIMFIGLKGYLPFEAIVKPKG